MAAKSVMTTTDRKTSTQAEQRSLPTDTISEISPTARTPGRRHLQEPARSSAAYGGTGTIYYCLTGSGFGRSEFESNNGTATVACAGLGDPATGFGGRQDPLDFVGSDVAMASTECCASGTTYANGRLSGSVQWGQPFELPSIGGPIVYGYRPGDFPSVKIKLSTWTYCAIANGTIGDWNDPAITQDNGGSVTGGVSEPITFYYPLRQERHDLSLYLSPHSGVQPELRVSVQRAAVRLAEPNRCVEL